MNYLTCFCLVVTFFSAQTERASVDENPKVESPALIEFRRASFKEMQDWKESELRGGDRKIWVHPQAEVSDADLQSMKVIYKERFDAWMVSIKFSEEGAQKMRVLTKEIRNQPLAILLNGKVFSAPVVREQLSSRVMISGLSEKEAKSLVESFQQRKRKSSE